MTYIYDIIINDSDELYDFYDWREDDNLKHIRKVPLFKVNTNVLIDFVYHNVKVCKEFIELIKNKTEYYYKNSIRLIEHAFIICNGDNSLYVELNDDGLIIKKSKFLVNEEIEIIDISSKMKVKKINYSVISNCSFRVNTRKEQDVINEIVSCLDSVRYDRDKIEYLYSEWFGRGKCNYEKLVDDISSKFTKKHESFLKTLLIVCSHNNV